METKTVFQKTEDFLVHNRIRLSLLIIAIFICENIIENITPHDIFDIQDIWGTLGIFLVLAGVGLRSWAAGIIKKNEALATNGPYSLMRHPLYIGSSLLAIGFCTIIGNGKNFIALTVIALVFYVPKIRREENRLADRFKEEWKIYVSKTSFLYPRSVPDLHSKWSLTQWFHHREYVAFLTCLIALAFLKLLHEIPISQILTAHIRK
ncbi:MAG: isoprenylcysteine carboxylmethyltransferase family protein [Nitrospirae bacterium]|nr:isoprenylcysteine carboxylmethyltransferase family protein [Nitrospirota bacterium]